MFTPSLYEVQCFLVSYGTQKMYASKQFEAYIISTLVGSINDKDDKFTAPLDFGLSIYT